MSILNLISAERARQDTLFQEQNHDDGRWALILQEELGEAAKDVLEGRDPETELVQCAAVIVAWIECRRRQRAREIVRIAGPGITYEVGQTPHCTLPGVVVERIEADEEWYHIFMSDGTTRGVIKHWCGPPDLRG